MATPRIADQIGRVLGGRYRLVAPIGTGASAHVYVADDVRLRRRVAVKILHPALAEDESFLRRFRAEAETVASLRHPHIMQVYDWGQDVDGPFLVLEHLAGGSLRDLLDRGHRLSPSQALEVGLQAAQALEHAHRRGLVHRDIKPANLLFDDEGRLSIADFGLARALAEAAWTEPAGAVLGTARYASPEQARGLSVDGKADVYALALSLIESVIGSVPFAADTTIATLMGRVDRDVSVPDELGALAAVLAAAGVADPAARIDAADLAARLDRVAGELPRPAPLPLATASGSAPTADVPSADDLTFMGTIGAPIGAGMIHDVEADFASPMPVQGKRRRLRWALIAVVFAVALVAGFLFAAAAMKPSYAVPDVRAKTLVDARRAVAAKEHFAVKGRAGAFYDETVPKGAILTQSPLAGDKPKQGGTIVVQVSDGPAPRDVPDLTGKTQAEAEAALAALRLGFAMNPAYNDTVPKGSVIDWSPKGTKVARDSTVTVTISSGKQPKDVPSLVDKLYDEAVKILEGLGLKAKKEDAFNDKVDAGKVASTKPVTPSSLEPGSEVTLVVSKGPEKVAVPNLSGMSEDEAISALESVGLKGGARYGPRNRRVFASNPGAGTTVVKGSSVDYYTG
ncbi:MAG: eukaryotic-like serine/threonine-protein kinase [Actinomycetota bacterium]|nr:eukaryotic-like serine/threonine-protein kinase [Actinomycetota bacterium]